MCASRTDLSPRNQSAPSLNRVRERVGVRASAKTLTPALTRERERRCRDAAPEIP
jgi:hypothetical protein